MPPNAVAAALTDGYRARLGSLRDATAEAVGALLLRVDLDLAPGALARDLAAWKARANLLVDASGGRAAEQALAYLAAYLAAGGVDATGAGEPALVETGGLAVVAPALFWRLGQKVGRPAALSTATASARMHVRTAIGDAAQGTLASGIAGEPGVCGWWRVTSGGSCSRCAALTGQTFHYDAGFDRHPGDRCTAEPVLCDVSETVTRQHPTVVSP